VAARTKATAGSSWPRPEPPETTQSRLAAIDGQTVNDEDENEEIAEVVPLRIFDAREEAKRKWW
jgi:putative transposase